MQKSDFVDETDISERERMLLDDCIASPLDGPEEIAANLIGDWVIEGYSCGFCAPGPSANGIISFMDSTGVVSYEYDGFNEGFDFSWEINAQVQDMDTVFVLETSPARAYLIMNGFCNDYMYSYDENAPDSFMFLYKKQ
jgi:hypothetical protein